jgi:hypothetical protein
MHARMLILTIDLGTTRNRAIMAESASFLPPFPSRNPM